MIKLTKWSNLHLYGTSNCNVPQKVDTSTSFNNFFLRKTGNDNNTELTNKGYSAGYNMTYHMVSGIILK